MTDADDALLNGPEIPVIAAVGNDSVMSGESAPKRMVTYETLDGIIPLLDLADPCAIRVVLDDDTVRLYVGPRDWSWDRHSGRFIGAGTALCDGSSLRPDEPAEPWK